MTTAFELASTVDTYLAVGISRVADPHLVYNTLSRSPPSGTTSVTQAIQPALDSASFTQTGTLVAAALSDSDLRTERIATLSQSIANGTYRIPSASVAESILKSALAENVKSR